MAGTVFVLIGIVFVLVALYRWVFDQSHSYDVTARKFNIGGGRRDIWRAVLFCLWTAALPLAFFIQWHANSRPPAQNMLVYQYNHKVLSDLWAAFAVILGVLFGLQR